MSFYFIVGALLLVWALSGKSEGYGPWPGSQPAESIPPYRSRPRDYGSTVIVETLPEARLPARRPVPTPEQPQIGGVVPLENPAGSEIPGASPLGLGIDYEKPDCAVLSDLTDISHEHLEDGAFAAAISSGRGPPRNEDYSDRGAVPVPAYMGPQPLRSTAHADDSDAVLAIAYGGREVTSPDDPNSMGRGISGQLNSIELVA